MADRRLIPAWAGNTLPPVSCLCSTWAHPRVGGEYAMWLMGSGVPLGSSPRGRGIPLCGGGCGGQIRLIPAWAGNTGAGEIRA